MCSKYNPTKGMTKEEMLEHWINESNKKFNNKFDYSAIKEISIKKSPITISCPEHGEFNTTFTLHLKSPEGCPQCGKISGQNNKRFSFEDFMKRLDEIQPERDYKILTRSFPEDSTIKTQYVYIQGEYGLHKIHAGSMLRKKAPAKPFTNNCVCPQQYFINRARKLHGYKYTYNNFVYKGAKDSSYITCPKHGDFKTYPNNHLSGCGCVKCGAESTAKGLSSDKEKFIKKCIERFGDDKKIFNKVEYKCAKTKVEILCEKHGYYKITPNCYLNGNRCRKCADEKHIWDVEDYKEICGNRQPILYKVRIFNEKESFIKIGITVQGVDKRFNSKFKLTGYKYEVLKTIQGDAEYIWKLEKRVHSFYKKYKYIPKTHFQGHTECFLA